MKCPVCGTEVFEKEARATQLSGFTWNNIQRAAEAGLYFYPALRVATTDEMIPRVLEIHSFMIEFLEEVSSAS